MAFDGEASRDTAAGSPRAFEAPGNATWAGTSRAGTGVTRDGSPNSRDGFTKILYIHTAHLASNSCRHGSHLREFMTPPDPPKRPIGFVIPQTKQNRR